MDIAYWVKTQINTFSPEMYNFVVVTFIGYPVLWYFWFVSEDCWKHAEN